MRPAAAPVCGAAPQPTDLLLASVASCFTLAFVHSAANRAIQLGGLRVDVVADYAGRRFAAVRISVDATGPDPGDMASLLEAAARVCYVTITLRARLNVEVFAAHRTDDPARDEIAGPQS